MHIISWLQEKDSSRFIILKGWMLLYQWSRLLVGTDHWKWQTRLYYRLNSTITAYYILWYIMIYWLIAVPRGVWIRVGSVHLWHDNHISGGGQQTMSGGPQHACVLMSPCLLGCMLIIPYSKGHLEHPEKRGGVQGFWVKGCQPRSPLLSRLWHFCILIVYDCADTLEAHLFCLLFF